MSGKKVTAALLAEFLGTAVLTLLILSVQRSQLGLQYFVAAGAGLAVVILMFVFGKASGGQFNPALTLALWTARKISTVVGITFIAAQFLGAYAGYGLYSYYANNNLTNVGGHYSGRILIAEAVGTFVFSMCYAAAISKKNSTAVRSAFAGLGYTVGILVASSAALGILNPAVALGIKAFVWGTYVLGPVLGAIVGINLYNMLFTDSKDDLAVSEVSISTSRVSSAPTKVVAPTKKAPAKKKTTSKK